MKLSLAVAATLLAAGMTAAAAEEPVKIGYAISKTGPFAPAAHTQINTYDNIFLLYRACCQVDRNFSHDYSITIGKCR